MLGKHNYLIDIWLYLTICEWKLIYKNDCHSIICYSMKDLPLFELFLKIICFLFRIYGLKFFQNMGKIYRINILFIFRIIPYLSLNLVCSLFLTLKFYVFWEVFIFQNYPSWLQIFFYFQRYNLKIPCFILKTHLATPLLVPVCLARLRKRTSQIDYSQVC